MAQVCLVKGIRPQQQVDLGLISYQNNSNISGSDNFTFAVSDAAGGAIGQNTFGINVIPKGNLQVRVDRPVFTDPNGQFFLHSSSQGGFPLQNSPAFSTFTKTPGYVTLLSADMFSAVDPGVDPSNIVYTVTGMPAGAAGFLIGQWGNPESSSFTPFIGRTFSPVDNSPRTFTQAELNSGQVFFRHSQNGAHYGDEFAITFSVSDNANNTVSNVSLPVVLNAGGLLSAGTFIPDGQIPHPTLTAAIGQTTVIGSGLLTRVSPQFSDSQITYSVWFAPQNGVLTRGGAPLPVNSHFTQRDVDQGLVTYVENGAAVTSDQFGLFVSDPNRPFPDVLMAIPINVAMTGTFGGQVSSGIAGAQLLYAGVGNNYFFGDGGTVVSYVNSPNGVLIDLMHGAASNGYGGTDTLTNIRSVAGSSHNDSILGSAGTDTVIAAGLRSDYQLTRQVDGSLQVIDLRANSPEGTDLLSGVEFLQFSDQAVNLAINHAPSISLVAGPNIQATSQGQLFQLSQLASASDSDGDLLTYAVVDFSPEANSGHFNINGQPMSGNVALLTAAQLAQTTFQAGANGATDHLRFGVNDTPGATLGSSGWVTQDFNVSAPQNHTPTINLIIGTNVPAASQNQIYQMSQLVNASDSDGDTLTYAVVDFSPDASSGHFNINGQPMSGNVALLNAAQLAQTTFQAGLNGSTDHLRFGVNDTPGATLSSAGWVTQDFNVIAPPNFPPTISLVAGSSVQATSQGQVFPLSQLASASDLNGDTLTYAVVDFSPEGNSGHFNINGQPMSGNVALLTAAQLAQTTFQAGANGATDHLRFGVNDTPGATLGSSGWVTQDFNVSAPQNHTPTINLIIGTNVPAASQNQIYQMSQLVNASDSDGDTLTYAVVDFSPDASSGHFNINGQPMSGNVALLNAAQLAQTTFQAGLNGSTDHLRFGVNDTPGATLSSSGWVTQDFNVIAPPNFPPQVSMPLGNTVQATSQNQVFQLSELFSATDSDPLTYAIVDFTAGNGSFSVAGQPLPSSMLRLLNQQQFGQTSFQVGSGAPDHLLIAVTDAATPDVNDPSKWVIGDFNVGPPGWLLH